MYRVGKDSVQLTATIDEETYLEIHAEAKELNGSASQIVRRVLREYTEQRKASKQKSKAA